MTLNFIKLELIIFKKINLKFNKLNYNLIKKSKEHDMRPVTS
jgi:hypothetical protein